jgi:hypothetical protein
MYLDRANVALSHKNVALELRLEDRSAERHSLTQAGMSPTGEGVRSRGILALLRMRPGDRAPGLRSFLTVPYDYRFGSG